MPTGSSALLIKPNWAAKIFDERKTVEIRGQLTKKRGKVYIIESGSQFITGEVFVVDCEGPVSINRWEELRSEHKVAGERLYGEHTYAYLLRAARRILPVHCAHTTQVTWVTTRT